MSNVVDIENLKYRQIKESLPRQKRLLSEEDEMFRETKEMFVELETELEKGNITETEYEDWCLRSGYSVGISRARHIYSRIVNNISLLYEDGQG